MAGERRGIFYEVVTEKALQLVLKRHKMQDQIFWNEKPDGINIVPDFTLGADKNHPTHVILVTASGSARNSEMKSWRNLAELQSVKSQLAQSPIVINLYFKSDIKGGLASVMPHIFDTTLFVDQEPYYPPIQEWVDTQSKYSKSVSRHTKQLLLEKTWKEDEALGTAIEAFADDLAVALTTENTLLAPLWELMREDFQQISSAPKAKVTWVRHGLVKLMLLKDEIREHLYDNRQAPIRQTLPEYVFDLTLFSKTLVGSRLQDEQIQNVIDMLNPELCEHLIALVPEQAQAWVSSIKNLSNLTAFVKYVETYYQELITPVSMYQHLVRQHATPEWGLAPDQITGKLQTIWLFDLIASIEKADKSNTQGFGLSAFERHPLASSQTITSMSIGAWCSCFMNQYFNRHENFAPPDEAIRFVALVLSERLAKIDVKTIPSSSDAIKAEIIKSNLNMRLIPYMKFAPLQWLLEYHLKQHKINYVAKTTYTGWISDIIDTPRRLATTPFICIGKMLIHWKSVTDAGRGHKRKELSARARNMKYQYDATSQTFKRRADVAQLALIVDGTFTDDDLRVLSASGWDLIVYPDEINRLIDAITTLYRE